MEEDSPTEQENSQAEIPSSFTRPMVIDIGASAGGLAAMLNLAQLEPRVAFTAKENESAQFEHSLLPKILALLKARTDAAGNIQQLAQSLPAYALVGHGAIKRKQLSLSELVTSTQADLAGIIAETSTEITGRPLPILSADPVQLKQVFRNLIVNAILYRSPEQSPRISITGEIKDDGWHISVADNGQGISPEHQDRIFELLTRLHGSDTPGSGIGLALCRTVVERHGGRIWVKSSGSGQGITFYFTISFADEPAIAQRSESQTISPATTRVAEAHV